MEDAFIDTLELFPRGLVYVGMSLALLVMAKLVQDLLTPYKIGQQLTTKDNVALALSISGYYLGVIIVFLGAVFQPDAGPVGDNLGFTSDYWQEVLNVLIYSAVGIVILNVARIVVDRVVLYQFSTEKEIIEDRNAGTGAVEFGVYVAVSLVIAGSISGEGGGPEHSLVFLALGLATLDPVHPILRADDPLQDSRRDRAKQRLRGRCPGGQPDSHRHHLPEGDSRGLRRLERSAGRIRHLRPAGVHSAAGGASPDRLRAVSQG